MLYTFLPHITTQNLMSFPIFPQQHAESAVCMPPRPLRSCHMLFRRPDAVVGSLKATLTVNSKTGGVEGMDWFYEMEKEVRDYELDQFGVVNNAIYNNYTEYGTFKLLENIGFDADTRFAVAEMSVKYIVPLKRKDKYMVKLKILNYSTTRLYFENHIVRLPNHEPILRGTATLVHVDENLRPSRITSSMVSKLNQFLLTQHKK